MKPSFHNAVGGSVVASDAAGNRTDAGADLGSRRNDEHRGQPAVSANTSNASATPPRLLDQVRARMRRLGMAIRSEDAYLDRNLDTHSLG